jgi:hypothetical protein
MPHISLHFSTNGLDFELISAESLALLFSRRKTLNVCGEGGVKYNSDAGIMELELDVVGRRPGDEGER